MAVNLIVTPKEGEPIEKLIRRFNRQISKKRILETYKEHLHYEKPSARRNRQKQQQKRRAR